MIKKIYHHTFENNLKLHYLKRTESQHITIEIWIKVGSANEKPSEYGICHMIEHMMFKGSSKIALGMLDDIMYQIGGKTNAHTGKDFTVYIFSVPKQFYESLIYVLSILFESPRFDGTDLEIEKKIVIQEILSYQDDSFSVLLDAAISNSKSKHNYQHSILGNIETVNSFTSKILSSFYKNHYIFENMRIFILGDLSFNKVKNSISKSYFNTKVADKKIKKIEDSPVESKKIKRINYLYSSTLNRHFLLTYILPACTYNNKHIFKGFNILLGDGKDSFLYKKLCFELKLVTEIKSFFHGFHHETFYFIYFIPINIDFVTTIISTIYNIIDSIKKNFISTNIIEKLDNILFFEHAMLNSENVDDFVFDMGPYFFDNKKNFLLYRKEDLNKFSKKIIQLAKKFNHKKSIINALLPGESNLILDKKINFEKFVSGYDNEEISEHVRENNNQECSEISFDIFQFQEKRLINQKKTQEEFTFLKKKKFPLGAMIPKHQKININNGMTIILENDHLDNEIVIITLSLEVKHYYDEDNYEGAIAFLFDWMYQGTIKYPDTKFIDIIEQYGIQFHYNIGEISIRFLKKYFKITIDILLEYLLNPQFSEDSFALLKQQTIDGIKNFMDDPYSQGIQYAKETIYKGHPYRKNPSGNLDSIENITPYYIKNIYKKYIIPYNSIMVIVGNIVFDELQEIIPFIENWQSKLTLHISFPPIKNEFQNNVIYKDISKDQGVVLYLAKSAVKYTDDFYYLLLAEQLLSGSLVDSMYSLLFQIREHTGLFYHIGGSLVQGSSKQPGMILISAMTNQEFIIDAIKYIKDIIANLYKFINEYDLYIAKQALLQAMNDKKSSKTIISQVLMNMYKYNLSEKDYIKNYNTVKQATLENITKTVYAYLNENNFYTIVLENKKT